MADEFDKSVRSDRADAVAVVRRLRDAGHIAYFAGGCVRDLLLGLTPKDFDVATDAPPDRVRDLFRNTQAVGAAFGVILVRQGQSVVEVATFRNDGKYLDGRRPSEMHFTTAQEDAQRRDFTINGLFLDPIADRVIAQGSGPEDLRIRRLRAIGSAVEQFEVIDFVGGMEDLDAKRLRAIGSPTARFEEDSLRLLRAVRLSSRLSFEIESATADAIRAHAPQLRRVSPERIAEELRMMLTPTTRAAAWELLWKLRLTPELFRFLHVEAVHNPDPPLYLFARVAPGEGIPFGPGLAAAAICYQLQLASPAIDAREWFQPARVSAAVGALRKSLKLSNEETDAMRGALAGITPLLADPEPTVAKMKRFLAGPEANWSRALLQALDEAGYLRDRLHWLAKRLSVLDKEDCAPPPLLDGEMLTAAGLSPGPIFRKLLDAAYDAQLEHRVKNKDEALAMAMRMAGEGT